MFNVELLGKWYPQNRAMGREYSVNSWFPENKNLVSSGTFRLERLSQAASGLKYNMENG